VSDDAFMSINFAALQQAHDDLAASHQAVQGHIETLEAELQSRLAHWNGDAKEAYYQVKQQWDGAIAHMQMVLAKAHLHLANANETYQSVEANNVGIWG
jgi:early secretory antigenic target protein ESAT-6